MIIDSKKEKKRIVNFLKDTFEKQNIQNAVIGLSGGIDSATSFYLLCDTLAPEHIFVAHLYYFQRVPALGSILQGKGIPEKNIMILSIKSLVDKIAQELGIEQKEENKVRVGNIAARLRMIILFDIAKKTHSLVCGTENRSEELLGYFTRFGDQASDIEPIAHLFKTQVRQLASYLDIEKGIVEQEPTAGLWEGQTDEGEFGFTYEEADRVLHLYFDKHLSVEEIEKRGLKKARSVIERVKRNEFKRKTPYHLTAFPAMQ